MEFQTHEDDSDINADEDKDDPNWEPTNNSVLSEECDDLAFVDAKETFEDKYHKIKSEIESETPRDQTVPAVNRKLYKIRLNDLLFSDHYNQLRDCVLQNRIQKMSDIEKMLNGEHVDAKEAVNDDKKFRKQHKDNQLIRDLCIAENYFKDHLIRMNQNVGSQEKAEEIERKETSSDLEMLMHGELVEDWT